MKASVGKSPKGRNAALLRTRCAEKQKAPDWPRAIDSSDPPRTELDSSDAGNARIETRNREREFSGRGRSRTADTRIFSPLLYHLSYPPASPEPSGSLSSYPLRQDRQPATGQGAFQVLRGWSPSDGLERSQPR